MKQLRRLRKKIKKVVRGTIMMKSKLLEDSKTTELSCKSKTDTYDLRLCKASSDNEIHNVVVKNGSITVYHQFTCHFLVNPMNSITASLNNVKNRYCDLNCKALVRWAVDENLNLVFDASCMELIISSSLSG